MLFAAAARGGRCVRFCDTELQQATQREIMQLRALLAEQDKRRSKSSPNLLGRGDVCEALQRTRSGRLDTEEEARAHESEYEQTAKARAQPAPSKLGIWPNFRL